MKELLKSKKKPLSEFWENILQQTLVENERDRISFTQLKKLFDAEKERRSKETNPEKKKITIKSVNKVPMSKIISDGNGGTSSLFADKQKEEKQRFYFNEAIK